MSIAAATKVGAKQPFDRGNWDGDEATHLRGGCAWFVLRTLSRQEKQVAAALGCQESCREVVLPLIPRIRYYGHRRRVSEVPLFPGYVFARGSAEAAYAVMRCGRVAQRLAVPDQEGLSRELSELRQALASGEQFAEHGFLKEGRLVRVRCGPLRGVEGVVEDCRRPTRLVLQVNMLGRATSVEIEADLLEPA